ncbi:phosphoribosylamine--glycine ligase [Hyphomicrobium methylovorum]|uniref:phosphoribosylamine--glycine ligase n=1 Tax=Hyphomicrobium methylovorum TaxID=84 RepID=UPI0015E64B2C|nr:phosphoribosylamine--glycine ligase [Hyphomicrobium methylovorum]MBA2126854.1 phosphoribosylamine--glycine ligase [Hyphomicrobium methylovorum]
MNVLLIGAGGREHALAWALSASPLLTKLFCAPGNPGIAELAECVALDAGNHEAVIGFCRDNAIEFVVIGPEAPLVDGLGNALDDAGIRYFGPTKAAAQLEGSKGFTKDLCREANIPTADYGRFTDATSAKSYLATKTLPIVVKADGLAAGKGVVIAATQSEAEAAIDACFSGAFGAAGREVLIEEFLDGEEASFFALCDGKTAIPLASAQDHKRVGEGDTGPNTGGMGAYSPAPVMTEEMTQRVMREIIEPTVKTMASRGTPFKGVLFAGLMITSTGPKLIEYNVRFGDPETQVLMLRLKSDLLSSLIATADGVLGKFTVRWSDDAALTVVMAAEGYPGTPTKDTEIKGLETARQTPGVEIFHAGTRRDGPRLLANGGRVLNITGRGRTIAEARDAAYAAIEKIEWPGGFYRTDIGWRALKAR